jgi:hypothetical protein
MCFSPPLKFILRASPQDELFFQILRAPPQD